MKQVLRRAAGLIGAGLGAAALLGLGYVGVTWSRYGKINHRRRGDRMLDRFMPEYEVREQHQTKIAAPADVTFTVAREFDFQRSGLVRAIFTGRELIMGSDRSSRQRAPNFLSMVLELGWRILAEEPGRELVLGAVTQPWKADVEFRGLTPEEFIEFHDPGYVKIGWTLAVEPLSPTTSILRTETRVLTTDPESRSRFRRYWSVFSPGILLIRREVLRLIRREAERRVRAGQSRTTSTIVSAHASREL